MPTTQTGYFSSILSLSFSFIHNYARGGTMNAQSLNGQVRSALTLLLATVCISRFSAQAGEQPRTLQTFGVQVKHGQPVYPLPNNVALGLFNPEDPFLDVAYAKDGRVQVWQNLGNGTFGSEPVFEYRVNGAVAKMEWRKSRKLIGLFDDIHSWGDLHIAFTDGRSETITHSMLLNKPVDLSFVPALPEGPPFSFQEVWRSERNPFGLPAANVVGDFDNNGRLNIATYFALSPSPFDQRQRLVFYEHQANNQFAIQRDTVYQNGFSGPYSLTDVDGDGHKEIAIVRAGQQSGLVFLLECLGPGQYREYRTNIGIQPPKGVYKILETDINHNGIKELCVLTSDPQVSYDQTFIYIAEFVGKGPCPSCPEGWLMAFNQTIARVSEYVFDMAVGQVDGEGWDEIILGDGAWLSGPPETISYLKYNGVPGVFSWRFHSLEVGLPATCTAPMYVNLDNDTTKELLIGGVGPLGHGSVYGIKRVADTTYRVLWIDSTLAAVPTTMCFGLMNNTRTAFSYVYQASGPQLTHSQIEIHQEKGSGVYAQVGYIPLLQDTTVFLSLALADPDSDGRADIIGGRVKETRPAFDNRIVDLENDTSTLGIDHEQGKPDIAQLFQNYPNPFNPSTKIRFELSNSQFVDLSVFNMLGQRIGSLVHEMREPGRFEVEWDAGRFASGLYFYRMRSGEVTETRKMLLIR